MDNSLVGPSTGGQFPRFDAYAASVSASPSDLRDALEGITHGATWQTMDRAPLGYAHAARLVDADGQVGQLWWGGTHARPHCSFQGEASDLAAGVLRECFPAHSVSRADPIIVESTEPEGYDRLQALCVGIAQARRVKVGTAGDHLVTLQGRTLYLGSPKSSVRSRLYDKRAELLARLRDPAKLMAVPDHYARLEAQIRPQTPQAKADAAKASPFELLGSAEWLRELVAVTGAEPPPKFEARAVWREADEESAYWWMLRQFPAALRHKLLETGSPECLGLQIVADLAELERHR